MTAIKGKSDGAGFFLLFPLLTGCMACLAFFMPGVTSLLQYDRDCVEAGEIWRLLTSHWTHWSAEHLVWDVVVFIALLMLSLRIDPKKTILVFLLGSAGISLGIYYLQHDLVYYRGLSGLDAALFAFIAAYLVKFLNQKGNRVGRTMALLLLSCLVLKIAYEAIVGEAIWVSQMAQNVTVVPLAHVIGGGIGLTAGIRLSGASIPQNK